VRNVSFALLFGFVAYIQPVGYRHSFPTLKERLAFEHSFGANKAIRLFYGTPHDLLSVGGYSAWRVGGVLAIFAGMWGLLAAVRALRAEEEAGRQELVLAGSVPRRVAFGAAMAALGAGAGILWLAVFLGLLGGRLPAGGSAYLAVATISPVPVFAGIGALACQIAPTRRLALEIASIVLVVALLLRVVADTLSSLAWLRWVTPLGWAEELRPFAGPRPAVVVLPLLVGAVSILIAGWIAMRRDVGAALIAAHESVAPRRNLLSSPTAQALRLERGGLIGWFVGIGFFALIMGMISHTFSSASISSTLQKQLAKVGGGPITTPAGALGFYFLFFVLATSLFVASQIAAARHEESDQRLETVFALPVARERWLAGRLVLAIAGATALALAAGGWRGRAPFRRAAGWLLARCSEPAPTACRRPLSSSASPRLASRCCHAAASASRMAWSVWPLYGSSSGRSSVRRLGRSTSLPSTTSASSRRNRSRPGRRSRWSDWRWPPLAPRYKLLGGGTSQTPNGEGREGPSPSPARSTREPGPSSVP
jgi:ABC-2 type transport system permease protein